MDKLQVAKFNGKTDFPVWKVQVRAYLEANSWFGTIDGSTVTTQAWGAANPEWQKTEAKAKAVILNSVETSVVRTIMNLKTAKEMWTRLSTLYESHSKLSVSLLRQEFYSYRMTESMDMATHIANVESMVQRLNDVDKAVSEDEIVTKLLQLPKKYHHLVTAWDTLNEYLQTRENLISRLLKIERLTNDDEKHSTDQPSSVEGSVALLAKGRPMQSSKTKFAGECHFCGRTGHKKFQCRKFQQSKKPSGSEKPQKQAHVTDLQKASTEELLFSADYTDDTKDDEWLADTGAARHICIFIHFE